MSDTKATLEARTIQVDDKVYSAKALADEHPGGDLFIKAFAGRDATEAFMSYHRRRFPHDKMKHTAIGKAVSIKSEDADKDYIELCEIIDKVLPRAKSFAPTSYFVKAFTIIAIAVGLELYIHLTRSYKWYLTAVLGLVYAFIGLNIQHDANHGAISRNPRVNRLLGLTQNWIGGSAVDWIHQHVVQHHVHTNDLHHDPDIAGNTFIRLNPLQPLLHFHVVQHIYIFLLICGFGFSVVFTSMQHLYTGMHKSRMSEMLAGYRVREFLATFPFFLRWFVLPIVQVPSVQTALNVAPMFVTGGFYLAFFFVISHNFVGVHMFDKTKTDKKKESFLYSQVASSCNVGGPWLAFINGGLNYQIEHHLFPRISHTHYPKIAPVVREFCRKKGIPYVHFPTISENMASCVNHLYKFGNDKNPYPSVKAWK
mmetsp:Transcript_21480/g.31168  ORF Transcript_21480/g.31168 Transcript_21480/m.31168 type:complete len:424 (+) Transcript_21480:53-1324(+)